MWTKYDYLCTDCDALIEITACADKVLDPACICGGYGIVITYCICIEKKVTTK
jgi:hypothetical protein